MTGVGTEQGNGKGETHTAAPAPGADSTQSVRETLRRAQEALLKANQPLPNVASVTVVPDAIRSPMAEQWNGNSVNGGSLLLPQPVGDINGSHVFSTPGSGFVRLPSVRGSSGSIAQMDFSQHHAVNIAPSSLYGSQRRDPSPFTRRSADGVLYSSGALDAHRTQSSLQQPYLTATQSSFQQATVAEFPEIPRKIVSTEFLSDRAREILRLSGQELDSPNIESKMWSSLNDSHRISGVAGNQSLNASHQFRSFNHSSFNGHDSGMVQWNGNDVHNNNAPSLSYDEGFVSKMQEEMNELRRKLHEEQAAREATAQQFRRSCINLEDAMKDKAHLQKALEQAAIGSGLKELQERLNTEVSKRESAERMLASVQDRVKVETDQHINLEVTKRQGAERVLESTKEQVQAAQTQIQTMSSSVQSLTKSLDLKDAEIKRQNEKIAQLHGDQIRKEEEFKSTENALRNHYEKEIKSKEEKIHEMSNAVNSDQSNSEAMQAEMQQQRKSTLAMALQLKRCVEDLAEAQKRISSQEKQLKIVDDLKRALAESSDLNDAATEEIEFLGSKCRQLEQEKAELLHRMDAGGDPVQM